MANLYFCRGAIGDAAFLREHQEEIDALVNGDYTPADLEVLKGHRNIFSYRLNKTGRLLFTITEVDGARYLLLLEHLPTHNYNQSHFLRAGVLKHYLIKHEDAIKDAVLDFERATEIPEILKELPKDGDARIALDYYHDKFIQLSDEQNQALTLQLPAVISGGAGSGKSCVAISLLSEQVLMLLNQVDANPCKMLYVSESAALVNSMKDTWNKLPLAQMTGNVTVEFKTYDELLLEQCPELKDHNMVGRDYFDEWYSHYTKKQQQLKKVGQQGICMLSNDTAYQEFRICSIYTEEDYLSLGERQSSLPKSGPERKALYVAYQQYTAELNHIKAVNPAFYPFKKTQGYFFIVVDEAQDFSNQQIKNLQCIPEPTCNIAYFMDSHQSLFDAVSNRPYLLDGLTKDSEHAMHHINLPITYRCPFKITEATNSVIKTKYQFTGGIADKREVSEIKPNTALGAPMGHLFALDKEALQKWDWLKKQSQGAHFAVVATDEHRSEAMTLYPEHRVFSPEQIKGLEYDTVVVFKPYSNQTFKTLHTSVEDNTETTHAQHRAKSGDNEPTLRPCFNQVIIAFTRAKKTLVVYEENTHDTTKFLRPLESIRNNEPLTAAENEQKTSVQDWENEILRLIAQNQRARAVDVYVTCLKPGANQTDFDDFVRAQQQKNAPVEPVFLTRPTQTKAPTKQPEPAPKALDQQEKPKHPPIEPVFSKKTERTNTPPDKPSTTQPGPAQKSLIQQEKSEQKKPPVELVDSKVREQISALLKGFTTMRLGVILKVYGVNCCLFLIHVDFNGQELPLIHHLMNNSEYLKAFTSLMVNDKTLFEKIDAEQLLGFAENHTSKESTESKAKLLLLVKALRTYAHAVKKVLRTYANRMKGAPGDATLACDAATKGDAEALQVLYDLGADLNKAGSYGFTPAFCAAGHGEAKALQVLHDMGADLNKAMDDGATPAYVAAQENHVNVLELLGQWGANLNQPMHEGVTPAFIAAERGHVRAIEVLAKYDVNFNAPGKDGRTLAHVAAQNCDIKTLQMLSDLDVDLNQPMDDGATPAFIAAGYNRVAAIRALGKLGVDLNKPTKAGFTPAIVAAQKGYIEALQALREFGANLNQAMDDGATPAFVAAEENHVNVLELLGQWGANLNQPMHDVYTPAFIAAEKGHVRALRVLVKYGVNLNAPAKDGLTLAHVAAQNCDIKTLRMLSDLGADLNKPMDNGTTPADISKRRGHFETAKMLEALGSHTKTHPVSCSQPTANLAPPQHSPVFFRTNEATKTSSSSSSNSISNAP